LRTRKVAPAKARIHWEKATRFCVAAQAAAQQEAWDAAVSSAIHAAISMVDAICVRHLGERVSSDNHDDAVTLLFSIERIPREEREQIAKHYRGLIALKHWAEYDDRLCTRAESSRALQAAARMSAKARAWVE